MSWCTVAYDIVLKYARLQECDVDKVSESHFVISKDNKIIHIYPILGKYTKEHSGEMGYTGDLWTFLQKNFGEHSRRFNGVKKVVKTKEKPQRKKININSPMPVGKYKGTPIKEVPKSYLRYILDMGYSSKEVLEFLRQNEHILKGN